MRKGHLLKLFFLAIFLIFSFVNTQNTFASSNILSDTTNSFSVIPYGKESLFYNNNIMFYEYCQTGSGSSVSCSPPSGDQITWIGDSYSSFLLNDKKYTYDYIEEKLPGVDFGPTKGDATSYVQGSKFANSGSSSNPSGISILEKLVKENKLRPYLVFALGTNGYGLKESEVKKVLELAGSDTNVIFVTVRTRDHDEKSGVNNDAIRKAAQENNNVTLIDWVAKVGNDVSQYYGESDEIHPTSSGLKAWVDLIIEGLPSSCGGVITSGDTAGEKIWSGFARLGYTDYQIAGIIGNIANEGGMSPARWEDAYKGSWGTPLRTLGANTSNSIGMGLTGFTFYKHLINLADAMDAKAPDLMHYLEQDASKYGGLSGDDLIAKLKEENGTALGDMIANRLFSIQVQYIHDTIQHDYESSNIKYTYPDFDYSGLKSVEGDMCAVSDWWLYNYEKPKSPNPGVRCNSAKEYYNKFHGQKFDNVPTSSASSSTSSSSSSSSSSTKSGSVSGANNYDSILHAKNASKQSTDFPGVAGWDDLNNDSMKALLETYGDLAYQVEQAVGAPYVAVLVQMRYEDSNSSCGKNNFWGNGCSGNNAYAGGAKIQGKNLGEGFVQYAQTLSESQYDYTRSITDPKKYLEAIGPMWVQGDRNGDGYGSIEGMKQSVDALQKYINSAEGQAIVKTFGGYHEDSASLSSEATDCNGDSNKVNCVDSGAEIADTAVSFAWPDQDGKLGSKAYSFDDAKSYSTATADYQKAFTKVYGGNKDSDHTQCNQFVATVVRSSGVDTNFATGDNASQLEYLQKTNTKWSELEDFDGGTGSLKPGDILVANTKDIKHVMIYVGSKGGSYGDFADASAGDHTAIVRGNYSKSYLSNFHAFRAKGNCDFGDGLSKEEAQRLADFYNSDAINASTYSLPNGKTNCVSFSAFFVQHFTDLGLTHNSVWTTNGGASTTVKYLHDNYNFTTGTIPQVYSVFSVTWGATMCGNELCGHTGVIVGKEDDQNFITVEASYPSTPAYVTTQPIIKLVQSYGDPFAYTSDRNFDSSKLAEIINK